MPHPDVIFKKSFLSLAEQKEVYEKVLQIEPGFYVPLLRNGNRMNLLMNCLGYHWSAVTYEYTRIRDIDNKEAAPVPDFLQALARRALKETDYWQGPGEVPAYDICIVNWYDENGGKLGVHTDNSETAASLAAGYPVVSLSIGATAVFTIGGLSRKVAQENHLLESGEVVIFGRSMRLAYHGVTRLVRRNDTDGAGLQVAGAIESDFSDHVNEDSRLGHFSPRPVLRERGRG